MTLIYFVRHAQADHDGYEQDQEKATNEDKPLSEKGKKDCQLVTDFLQDKNIDIVISSPYVRAVDTVSPFAKTIGAGIETIWDFREREKGKGVKFTQEYFENQWRDFSHKLSNGECLSQVQERNIKALQNVLEKHKGKNIVIGTHVVSLGTIINHYDNSFGFEQIRKIGNPYVVKMQFDGHRFLSYDMIDLFDVLFKT